MPVESSAYNPTILLDTIEEKQDDGPLPEYDLDDGPGEYRGSSGRGVDTASPMTRSRARNSHGNTEPELFVQTFLG